MIHIRQITRYPQVFRRFAKSAHETVVWVDGLACDAVCSRRTMSAMLRARGVLGVRRGDRIGEFVLSHDGPAPDEPTLNRAIESVIMGKPLRRLLARFFRA